MFRLSTLGSSTIGTYAMKIHTCALLLAITCFTAAAVPVSRAAVSTPDGFEAETIASGLDQPVAVDHLPDGRLLVAEQRSGNIRLILDDGSLVSSPVLTVTGLELLNNEAGLLSLAIDPSWPERPYIYCHYTNDSPSEMRLTRYTATGTLSSGSAADLQFGTAVHLLTGIPDVAGNHNGGTLLFGPDGHLFFSIGDDETQCAVPDNDRFEGKVLRLGVSEVGATGPVDRADLVVTGNPFVGQGEIASLVWTKGLRNPFRMTLDPVDGALFIGDVGEVSREEISRVDGPGLDLGWPFREGTLSITPEDGCTPPTDPDYLEPIWDYPRDQGVSVVAAFVYRAPDGASNPWPTEYEGDVFYTDFFKTYLRRLTGQDQSWSIAPAVAGQPTTTDWARGLSYGGDFTITSDGSVVFVSTLGGTVERIRYTEAAVSAPPARIEGLEISVGPNPFNPTTRVTVRSEPDERLAVRAYNSRGRKVATLFEGVARREETRLTWNPQDLPSGIYHLRATSPRGEVARKVSLLK